MSIEILGVRVNPTPRFVKGDEQQLKGMLAHVAECHGITVHRLKYGGRTRVLVNMRREFCKAARDLGYSLPQIGWALGCLHSSVLNLLRGRYAKKLACRTRRELEKP